MLRQQIEGEMWAHVSTTPHTLCSHPNESAWRMFPWETWLQVPKYLQCVCAVPGWDALKNFTKGKRRLGWERLRESLQYCQRDDRYWYHIVGRQFVTFELLVLYRFRMTPYTTRQTRVRKSKPSFCGMLYQGRSWYQYGRHYSVYGWISPLCNWFSSACVMGIWLRRCITANLWPFGSGLGGRANADLRLYGQQLLSTQNPQLPKFKDV